MFCALVTDLFIHSFIVHHPFYSWCLTVQCAAISVVSSPQHLYVILRTLLIAGLLRVLESPGIIFSRFLRPGKSLKTDMVLESPWICVWRSLKVLEFDFLKRGQEARESYFSSYLKHAENAIAAGARPRTLLGSSRRSPRPSTRLLSAGLS